MKKFLAYLQKRIPTGGRRHHITLDTEKNLLEVGVWLGGSCHRFLLSDSERLTEKLAAMIVTGLGIK